MPRRPTRAKTSPRAFPEWHENATDRAYDAANAFGYELIRRCRDEALKKDDVEKAVDIALHNVLDLLEGFWPLELGSKHSMELALVVRVRDRKTKRLVDSQELSPCKLDLPIGYWKWARDRDFR